MESAVQVQILDEAVHVSLHTNGKSMSPYDPPPVDSRLD